MSRARKPAWRIMTLEEIAASEANEPVPIGCELCQDSYWVLGDSVFVNTAHNYGVEYLGAPCPRCNPDGSL
jgi:hypothetical protein